ncbi:MULTISPECIES: hypothetical protein [unclassified Flavobacterium]|uniref:hypothetical protein n=1 Tax=unclassified Flavobacterium TaxID=196869 RepID=UPI00260E5C32|nr:hypothetical protein [Flavobacterium sp.]
MKQFYSKSIIGLFLLFITSLSAQSAKSPFTLTSVNSDSNAILKVTTTQDLTQGYTIEVQNNACGINPSEYLEKPVFFKSTDSQYASNFTRSNNDYIFTSPLTLSLLSSKWFRWRVIDNKGVTSQWMCYSWSDYCTTFLKSDGSCKN